MHPAIFTFGYTGQSIDALHRFINQHDALLIDVRYNPTSRVPTWRMSTLVKRFGDRYHHLPSLGNTRYRLGPPITLADPDIGLRELLTLLDRGHPLILMCACPDARTCHRTVIAQMLHERGLPTRELALTDPPAPLFDETEPPAPSH